LLQATFDNEVPANWGHQDEFFTPGTVNFPPLSDCPEDFDENGVIDISDFLAFNSAYGSACGACVFDLSGNGIVDISDFLAFNSAYGQTCPTLFQGPDELEILNPRFDDDLRNIELGSMHPELQKAIEDLRSTLELHAYPNPTDGASVNLNVLEYGLEVGALVDIQVLDMTGKLLMTKTIVKSMSAQVKDELIFDTPLSDGLYIIRAESNGMLGTVRFMVN